MMPSGMVAPLHARLSTVHSFTRARTVAKAIELRSHAVSFAVVWPRGGPPRPAAVESPRTIACTPARGGPGCTATGAICVWPTSESRLRTLRTIPGRADEVTQTHTE